MYTLKYRYYSKTRTPTTTKTQGARRAASLGSNPEKGDDSDDNFNDCKKKPNISKKRIKKLLDRHGKDIWKKLRTISPDKFGPIWKDPNRDFRVDAGSVVKSRPNIKTWNLQLNKEAGKSLKENLGDRGMHKKVFWGATDLEKVACACSKIAYEE
jgi:hypothetical protein